MFQTTTSINSQGSPSNKFKFRTKVSFFNDGQPKYQSAGTIFMYEKNREMLTQCIEDIQSQTEFINTTEFEALKKDQLAFSIHYFYNTEFSSVGTELSREDFSDLVQEIKQTITRKYINLLKLKTRFPFVKVFTYQATTQQSSQLYLQLQLYQHNTHQIVLYNKEFSKLPITSKLAGELLWLYVKKFSLTVSVDCATKNVIPVCEDGLSGQVLEGLRVTVRQKEQCCMQTPTKKMVIRTSFCQSGQKSASDMYKSGIQDEMEKSVRVYFSPSKTIMTSQIDMRQPQQRSPDAKDKQFVIKLFSTTQLTNCFEEVKFPELVQQVNYYEVEISGQAIQTLKTPLQVCELLDYNSDSLHITTQVKRTDIIRVLVKAPIDSLVNVSRQQLTQTIIYDEAECAYTFYGRTQQEYEVSVSKKDCFPLTRSLFLQGSQDIIVEFDLVSCVATTLQFKCYNIITQAIIENAKLEITQTDQVDQEPRQGQTDQQGLYSCSGLMFKQMRVHAQRKGFLQVSYDFDVRANSTGQILNIPMIPEYYSLINQFHIIIYVPNKHNFQLDYGLLCPDNYKLDQKNRQHSVMKCKLDISRISSQTQLWNFSVHVQSMDPFLNNNCFQFFVSNQKPKRALMCQEPLSPQQKENTYVRSFKSINDLFFKTRMLQTGTEFKTFSSTKPDVIAQKINNFCAEESVRIFVTFGHKVLETMMIQSNLMMMNEKCLGTIDLDKRSFYRDNENLGSVIRKNLSRMPKFKKDQQQQQNEDHSLATILSHITNQKFYE